MGYNLPDGCTEKMIDDLTPEDPQDITYQILQDDDDDAESPRTWCNTGVMWCKHPRYILGDKDAADPFEEDAEGNAVQLNDVAYILPLYLCDHSGLTMSHTPFGCPWDSGQVGWHYITKEVWERERIKSPKNAKRILKGELKVYDLYLRGEVWGYTIESDDGEVYESSWGFYGSCLEETGILDSVEQEHRDGLREAWENRFRS